MKNRMARTQAWRSEAMAPPNHAMQGTPTPSTVCSDGNVLGVIERSEMAEGAPLMAVR